MLRPIALRTLNINGSANSQNKAYISAASGLALSSKFLFCIADDLNTLAKFNIEKDLPGEIISLGLPELPADKTQTKKYKPDFESILKISKDSIILLPSGSGDLRNTAVLFNPDRIFSFSLKLLFAELSKSIPELNIEGAIMTGSEIILFQRGNGKNAQNSVITLSAEIFLHEMDTEMSITGKSIKKIQNVYLNTLNNVPLSFTDACLRGDRIYFLAAAENSASTWEDGEFSGAIIGEINTAGHIISRHSLEIAHKPEGLEYHPEKDIFLICTDSDDPDIPGMLYSLEAKTITED
jgi:hypothetical protein